MRAYPAREAGGYVWVYFGEKTDTLPPLHLPPEFDEPGWTIARRYHDVETDYTRLLEQNVDLTHFGFVHRGTFGRNVGPKDWQQWEVISSPQGFRIKYGHDVPDWMAGLHKLINKRWNSRIAASDALMAGIHFEMPNVFRVIQGGVVLGLLAVPIERGRTRLYQYTARCWFIGVPVLSWLLSQLTLQLNRIILLRIGVAGITRGTHRNRMSESVPDEVEGLIGTHALFIIEQYILLSSTASR